MCVYVFFRWWWGGAFLSLFLLTNLVSVSLVGCNFAHAGASLSLSLSVCLSLRHNFSLDPCISVCIVFFFSLISPPFPRKFCVSIGRVHTARQLCLSEEKAGRKEGGKTYTHTHREREREEREDRWRRGDGTIDSILEHHLPGCRSSTRHTMNCQDHRTRLGGHCSHSSSS